MKTEYRFICFIKEKMLVAGKPAWECVNKKGWDMLGIIKWYPSLRRYCFSPNEDKIYSNDCLEDIEHFMKQLKEETGGKEN